MWKKIFIFLLIILSLDTVFAAWKDCEIIETLEKNWKTIFSEWEYKIIDKDVYEKSLNNLKRYCDGDKSVLETNVFINQLLDIAFRKLDWIKWISYWIKFDEKAIERREYLNWIQKEYETPPGAIHDKFMQIWWEANDNTKANNNTLYGKYMLACKELKNIFPIIKHSHGFDWSQLTVNSFEIQCNDLVKQRYAKELEMVKKISFQNYNHIVNNTLYKALNQTLWKKLWDLYDKIMQNVWIYEHIVRRYMHVTNARE